MNINHLLNLLNLQPLIAESQAIMLHIPKASVEIVDQLWWAWWAGWRNSDRWRASSRWGWELAVIDIDTVLSSTADSRIACAWHVALLVSIWSWHTSRGEGIRAPTLLAVLGSSKAESESDAGGGAGGRRLVSVTALNRGEQGASRSRVRVASQWLAVIDHRWLWDQRRAVKQIDVPSSTTGLARISRAHVIALRWVDGWWVGVVQHVAAPALLAELQTSILETHGQAGGLARLGGLRVLAHLRVEGQHARGEAEGVGVAAQVQALRCSGGWCGGGGGRAGCGGRLGRGLGGRAGWFIVTAAAAAVVRASAAIGAAFAVS